MSTHSIQVTNISAVYGTKLLKKAFKALISHLASLDMTTYAYIARSSSFSSHDLTLHILSAGSHSSYWEVGEHNLHFGCMMGGIQLQHWGRRMAGLWDEEPPTTTTAQSLSMPEVFWEKEVTEKGNPGQKHYSGQLSTIQRPSCSHMRPLSSPLSLRHIWTGLDYELHLRSSTDHTK